MHTKMNRMSNRSYRVFLEPDDGAIRCIIPAFPSIHTFGSDRIHALAMAQEAISLEIEALRAGGFALPDGDADTPLSVERVTVPA